MKAFAILRYGARPALVDLPEPLEGPELVARTNIAGVNPVDWKSIDRLTEDDTFPFVLGQDFAGTAAYVEGDPAVIEGDRVFGIARTYGAYAEATRVPPLATGEVFARIPDGLSDEQAAALPTAGLTALGALDVLGVEHGTTLAILGATGGVGSYATQVAKARGAFVIAIVRDGAAEARELGADQVILTGAGDPIAELRDLHPRGVDAILDVVSPAESVAHDTQALRPGGRIASTIRALDEKKLRESGFQARNVNLADHSSADALTRLAEMVADGTVRARIAEVRPLAEAADVLARAKAGKIRGKALLRVRA